MPRDPGLCRKPPDGNSTYARAGGVYPLAAFCDALVDRCLTPATNNGDGAADSAAAAATAATATEALRIVYDDVMKPGATRHAPGLKCEKAMLMPRNKARSCDTCIIPPPSLPLISRLFLSFSLLSFLLDSRS